MYISGKKFDRQLGCILTAKENIGASKINYERT